MNQEATRIRITESTDARNARLNREALRATTARILNQAQAEAVINAMAALNNVGGQLRTEIRNGQAFIAVNNCGGEVVMITSFDEEGQIVARERYENQDAFRTAYGMQ